MRKVVLREKFASIGEYWSPKIVAQVADVQVKVTRLLGEFPWHAHENEDELFLVVHGRIVLEFRDGSVPLEAGELLVVPKGVEHRPVAVEEAHVLLVEPAGTLNTGNVRSAQTIDDPEWI